MTELFLPILSAIKPQMIEPKTIPVKLAAVNIPVRVPISVGSTYK